MSKRQTFSLTLYCRNSKADKNGYAPIELSIVINGKRTYLKLQRKEKPELFKKNMQSTRENATKIFHDNQIVRINQIMDEMSLAGIELNAENLKACIRKGGVIEHYTLGELWGDIIDNKQSELKSGDIVTDTYKRYKLAKSALYAANGFTDQTPAREVELQHINNLQHYLRANIKTSQSTAFNYHVRCKSAFTLAFNRGKITSNPYSGFRMDKGGKTDIEYLTKSELARIAKKQLDGRLDRIRDLFLFQCYSGLAYSDMASLTPEDFTCRQGDLILIKKRRKKTGVMFKSMVYGEGIRVLEKYQYRLPVLSNEKYNTYLKELQTICGIEKRLHTHLGRTTYICFLYNKHVDPTVIAEIVGHTSCKTTLKYYAKMESTTIFNTFKEQALGRALTQSKRQNLPLTIMESLLTTPATVTINEISE